MQARRSTGQANAADRRAPRQNQTMQPADRRSARHIDLPQCTRTFTLSRSWQYYDLGVDSACATAL